MTNYAYYFLKHSFWFWTFNFGLILNFGSNIKNNFFFSKKCFMNIYKIRNKKFEIKIILKIDKYGINGILQF